MILINSTHLFHWTVVQTEQVFSTRSSNHLEDLDQLMCFCSEFLTESLILRLLVAFARKRKTRTSGEERLNTTIGLQRLE